MPKPIYSSGEYYHIYNRGVNRQSIFFDGRNWDFFIHRLREYFIPEKSDIVAYCLMPNHYHLLVHLKTDDFGHEVMQPFGTSYTKAINKEQGRVGALFQGRYQGKHVDKNLYLLHLSRYIHLNPVDAGLVSRPSEWEYSSYRDYIGMRNDTLPKPNVVIGQFGSVKDYIDFVQSEKVDYNFIRDLILE